MSKEVVVEAKRTKNLSAPRGAGAAEKSSRRYSPEFRLKAVRLHLEEGFSQNTVCTELDVGHTCLCRWVKLYRAFGEVGLQPAPGPARGPRLPAAIRRQMLALKQAQPTFGIQRISQLLRRWFLMRTSPETVRQHLHAAGVMPESHPPKERNLNRRCV